MEAKKEKPSKQNWKKRKKTRDGNSCFQGLLVQLT